MTASKKRTLPSIVSGFKPGSVEWKSLQGVDYDFLGYLLSCHLAVEHYMTHYLSMMTRETLAWEDAGLRFSQKVALLSTSKMLAPPYDFVPSIKHLNIVRNRFAHRLDYQLQPDDLKPLNDAILRAMPGGPTVTDPHDILERYTACVCAWFAGALAGYAHGSYEKKKRRPAGKPK